MGLEYGPADSWMQAWYKCSTYCHANETGYECFYPQNILLLFLWIHSELVWGTNPQARQYLKVFLTFLTNLSVQTILLLPGHPFVHGFLCVRSGLQCVPELCLVSRCTQSVMTSTVLHVVLLFMKPNMSASSDCHLKSTPTGLTANLNSWLTVWRVTDSKVSEQSQVGGSLSDWVVVDGPRVQLNQEYYPKDDCGLAEEGKTEPVKVRR